MTIRFTCAECASILKIKDELAGTGAKCPKCKTKFIVPSPEAASASTGNQPLADDSEEHSPPIIAPSSTEIPTADQDSSHSADVSDAISRPMVSMSQSDDASLPDHDSVDSPSKLMEEPSEFPTAATTASETGGNPDSDIYAIVIPPSSDAVPSEAPVMAAVHLQLEESDSDINALSNPSAEAEEKHVAIVNSANTSDDDDDLDSPPVFVSSVTPILKSNGAVSDTTKNGKRQSASELSAKSRKSSSASANDDAFDPMKFLMSDSPGKSGSPLPMKLPDDSDLSLPSDSNDDIADPGTPHPPTKRGPVASNNRAAPEKVDLATAAKMMKKAIKDSQSDAAHQRKVDAEEGYDYFLFLREFGARGFAMVGGSIVMIVGLYFTGQYVFGSHLKLPKLGYVKGTVKLDGQPLPGAIVFYAPVDAKMDAHNRARTSMGVTDKNGAFTMMYVDKTEGVAVGKCYVYVTHMGEKGNDVPVNWMQGTLATRDVTPGHQTAPADINMESKKAPEKN